MADAWRGLEIAFTGRVALFTIVLAVVSIKQGDIARKSVRRSTVAAHAAERAAKAAEESNKIMRNNEHAELRAYVSLGDARGKWIEMSKEGITLFFYNAGRTPARHFFVQFDLEGDYHSTYRTYCDCERARKGRNDNDTRG